MEHIARKTKCKSCSLFINASFLLTKYFYFLQSYFFLLFCFSSYGAVKYFSNVSVLWFSCFYVFKRRRWVESTLVITLRYDSSLWGTTFTASNHAFKRKCATNVTPELSLVDLRMVNKQKATADSNCTLRLSLLTLRLVRFSTPFWPFLLYIYYYSGSLIILFR